MPASELDKRAIQWENELMNPYTFLINREWEATVYAHSLDEAWDQVDEQFPWADTATWLR